MKTFKELYEACCAACEKRTEMEESGSGLAAKAEKSGVSLGTLRKVYKRGVAAWNSGHRPGTTPQQWGMARVNSYITKGKGTYHGADKDLREEEVELDEVSKVSSFIRKVKQRGIRHAVDPKGAAFQRAVDKADAIHQHKNLDVTDPERKKKLAKRVGKMLDVAGSIHARGKVKEEVAKDKESGLPKKYVSGLSPSTAKARAAHWEKMDKLSDRDPAAYEPAPGDATAKTRESKHTIKARKMFGEACWTGYKKVGMKKKGDKMVPNCVPVKEATHVGIYPHGGGSDIHHDDKPDDEVTNHPTSNAVGNEPHKGNAYFRRPKVKQYVGQIRKSASKGKPMPPVIGTTHPENPEVKSVVDGNHRLRGQQNARRENIPVQNVPHDRIHLMPHSYDKTPENKDMGQKIKTHGVSLSSLRNKDGKYDMDKPRHQLGGKTIRHYFTNTDGTHNFGEPPKPANEEVEQIDEISRKKAREYGDAAHEQESDIRHTLKSTEKSKHLSPSTRDELKKLADRRKAGIKLAADKRGYYKGSDAKANFTHGDAKVPATEETQKGKNVVPPTASTIATTGGIQEEEGENKPLGKVMRANDGKKKFKVFVKNSKGNVVKVGFGDPNMEIKRDDPERRKNFRARHNCDTAKDRTTPRYWSCRQWRSSAKVEA